MLASPVTNMIPVQAVETLPNGVGVLTVKCDDYDQFAALPPAVRYLDTMHGKSGWNSDSHVAYFRTDVALATGVR